MLCLLLLFYGPVYAGDAKGLRIVFKDSLGREVVCCSYTGVVTLQELESRMIGI
ncbi:MAG: hypothetical protein HYU36_03080 [Planctomycetes bacterium]|nr:hypothetical protein [Planctomycetota bacterium]